MILGNRELEAYLDANPDLTYEQFQQKSTPTKNYINNLTQWERLYCNDVRAALIRRAHFREAYKDAKNLDKLVVKLAMAVAELQEKVDRLE